MEGLKPNEGEVRAGIGSHNPSLSLALQASSLVPAESHRAVSAPLPSTTALNKAGTLAAESSTHRKEEEKKSMKYTV